MRGTRTFLALGVREPGVEDRKSRFVSVAVQRSGTERMDELETCGCYFEEAILRWISVDGSVQEHLRRVGRDGLIDELRSDASFLVVCRYLHRLTDVQYVHDPRYGRFRARITRAFAAQFQGASEARRTATRVVWASFLACGISPVSDRWVRVSGGLPR